MKALRKRVLLKSPVVRPESHHLQTGASPVVVTVQVAT